MKTIYSLVVAAGFVLTGCVTPPPAPEKPTTSEDFGIWTFTPSNCKVSAQRANMTMSTDGLLSDGKIYIKLSSDVPLQIPPHLTISHISATPLKLEGVRQHFSFEFPYDPINISRLIDETSFAIVTYFPQGENITRSRKAYFATKGLPKALAEWAKYCSI